VSCHSRFHPASPLLLSRTYSARWCSMAFSRLSWNSCHLCFDKKRDSVTLMRPANTRLWTYIFVCSKVCGDQRRRVKEISEINQRLSTTRHQWTEKDTALVEYDARHEHGRPGLVQYLQGSTQITQKMAVVPRGRWSRPRMSQE